MAISLPFAAKNGLFSWCQFLPTHVFSRHYATVTARVQKTRQSVGFGPHFERHIKIRFENNWLYFGNIRTKRNSSACKTITCPVTSSIIGCISETLKPGGTLGVSAAAPVGQSRAQWPLSWQLWQISLFTTRAAAPPRRLPCLRPWNCWNAARGRCGN